MRAMPAFSAMTGRTIAPCADTLGLAGVLGLTLTVGLAACSGDDGGGTGSADGTTTTTTTTTTEEGGAAANDGADVEPVCEYECIEDEDCCVALGSQFVDTDAFPCPGPYPNNWVCNGENKCISACSTDADCGELNIEWGWLCLPVDGDNLCFLPCEADTDCTGAGLTNTVCGGLADDDVKYCVPSSA